MRRKSDFSGGDDIYEDYLEFDPKEDSSGHFPKPPGKRGHAERLKPPRIVRDGDQSGRFFNFTSDGDAPLIPIYAVNYPVTAKKTARRIFTYCLAASSQEKYTALMTDVAETYKAVAAFVEETGRTGADFYRAMQNTFARLAHRNPFTEKTAIEDSL